MKIKGLRWCVLGMVAIATVINYIDRNALGIMWPEISKDLGMTKEDYALIVNAFMVAYAIGQSVFGKIFDSIGTRMGFVISILVWSLSVALHAIARTALSFGIFRFIMGFGEAGNWPGATKANAEWFPVNERAFAQGIFNAGASVGAIVSAPVIALLFLYLGWQYTFVLIAMLGVVWVLPWVILYKASPSDHTCLTDEERNYILTGQKTDASSPVVEDKVAPSYMELLKYRQSWSVILSRFFLDPVWWLFVSWLPIYLVDRFGFDVKQIGMFAWVPYVGAAIGGLFGGWLSGKLINRGWSVNKARKFVITMGGVIMFPSLILTSIASTPLSAVLLIAVILFGFQIAIGNIQTLPSDYFSGKSVGSLAGIGGTAAVLSVIVVNILVPILSKISYVPVFVMGAAFVPLAILAIWVIGGEIRPIHEARK